MAVEQLPKGFQPPETGWLFAGPWTEEDKALIIHTLQTRVLNPARVREDPWLFIVHHRRSYAHCPNVHHAGFGYGEDNAEALADTLWGHYFTQRLGPLLLASFPSSDAAPVSTSARSTPHSNLAESYHREQQALDHFQNARWQIAQGQYAAAQREMELSLSLYPANDFYSHKRVETLGDIESFLGDDRAAEHNYEHALALSQMYRESWIDTELRLKLAWCAMRRDHLQDARRHIDTAIALCVAGRAEDGGNRSLNSVHGLALATLADCHLHQLDLDTALTAAKEAAAIANRLGQAYGEKTRLLSYLAWQLYRHDEIAEAQTLATRAWTALDQWLPLPSAQTQAIRTTLTTILGPTRPRPKRSKTSTLPSRAGIITAALDAARRMENWVEQTHVLHTLAPYLHRGQMQGPFDDIIVWDKTDRSLFESYGLLLRVDLARAMDLSEEIPQTDVEALLALDPSVFQMLHHEYLYAETLVRLYEQATSEQRERVGARIVWSAEQWGKRITAFGYGRTLGDLHALTVVLPHLHGDVQQRAIAQIETHLIGQLEGKHTFPEAFSVALPALARLDAGEAVFAAITEGERHGIQMWVACLAHTARHQRDELRDRIVDAVLNDLTRTASYRSSADMGDILCALAPYLQGDEVHGVLALATPLRAILPRVRALTAIASVLPAEEQESVMRLAWDAAQRSKNVDTTAQALTELLLRLPSEII